MGTNIWAGHTIRVEKDAGISWRTPKGRAVGWGSPHNLASLLVASQGKYKLDLSRTPLKLSNLSSPQKRTNCCVLDSELSSLSTEEWQSLVIHPDIPTSAQHVLLFEPEAVQTRRHRGEPPA